jgi:D-alanyl-D-alanine carboxypeptidase/D-alanyl-D-alanine-endopeptidase (penicillin-binding protein 4)
MSLGSLADVRRGLPVVIAVLALAPSAHALSGEKLERKLAAQMKQAGSASGAYVEDLTTGEQLYALRGGTPRVPASNEKLWTSLAALRELGEAGTLRTTALATRSLTLDGTLRGNLYLRGEGDPTLSRARLEALAQDLREAGLTRVTGHVVGDESVFDTRRGPPSEGYRPSVDVAPLGALMVGRGFDRGRYQANPPAFAASVLARQLRDAGVRVPIRGRAGSTPAGALALATRRSPTVTLLLEAMNVPSDNYIAEMLLKAIGRRGDRRGTTARGAATVERIADEELGADPEIVDGSGLSRGDRSTPRELVTLLEAMFDEPAFYGSLAVMGRTGTLEDRLRRSYARGRCRGKTGTLSDVSALSGYCRTRGGDIVAFSILMNRVNIYGARDLQDRMVSIISRFTD